MRREMIDGIPTAASSGVTKASVDRNIRGSRDSKIAERPVDRETETERLIENGGPSTSFDFAFAIVSSSASSTIELTNGPIRDTENIERDPSRARNAPQALGVSNTRIYGYKGVDITRGY